MSPIVAPLVQSTAHAWNGFENRPEFSYAREGNPTVKELEEVIGGIESGRAVCYSSGLAAIDAVLHLVPPGGRIVVGQHVYGGTTRLLQQVRKGTWQVDTVDTSDRALVESALSTPADLVLVETPSNPTLRITDLAHLIEKGQAAGALVAVDNTFLTGRWQRPLDLGADLSIHSTTKYLDGHNCTLGGAVVVPPRHQGEGTNQTGSLEERLRWHRLSTGTNLAPFEAWLTLRGCKTLELRTQRQWSTAEALAHRLADRLGHARVYYPGLPTHPGHAIHKQQAEGGGGILAIEFEGLEEAATFVRNVKVWTLAENLGATESLLSSPALMTHAALGPERRAADGIIDGLVRLSVGIEDLETLWSDLDQALQQVPA